MRISVAIATYNRAEELRKTLATLARVDHVGVEDWEVLVIGNRCTDHTTAVAEASAALFDGRLRLVDEPQQGLSRARNRAAAEARFEVVAYLDDDVDVDPGWLKALCAAYEIGDLAAIGGRAHLVYPSARPGWLGERSEGSLTRVELGPDRKPATSTQLYGLNLSIRRDWIERVGGFRADLGRIGQCLLSSEETDLLARIEAGGGKLLYEPGAVVGHRVPPERLRRRWFWSRGYWGGLGQARCLPESEVTLYNLVRTTWWLVLAAGISAKALLRRGMRSEEFFFHSRRVAFRYGDWVGMVRRLAVKYVGGVGDVHRRPASDAAAVRC